MSARRMPADRTTFDPTPESQPRLTRLTFKKTPATTPRTLTHKETLFHTLPAAIRARHRGNSSSFWRDTDPGPRSQIRPSSLASQQTKSRQHHLPAPIFTKGHTIPSTKTTSLVSSSTNQQTKIGTNLGTTSTKLENSNTLEKKRLKRV